MQSDNIQIRRDFLTLTAADSARRVHYRQLGQGAPLLALHASPLCSEAMIPLMRALAPQATVIAPDTPGYGFSDPLPTPAQNIRAYADALAEFLDALGLASAAIYGSATGAQIAIEFARRYPQKTNFLLLENVAHFEEVERRRILENYFPSLAPRADGSHLLTAWHMARSMFDFFPWFDTSPAARVQAPLSVEAAHAVTLSSLRAGADYSLAYRCAFENEDFANILPISVPVRILHLEGGLLQRYDRQLKSIDWPTHIRVVPCRANPEQRFAALREAIQELAAPDRKNTPPSPSVSALRAPSHPLSILRSIPAPNICGGHHRCYLHTEHGQFHLRGQLSTEETVTLYLHGPGGSAAAWLPFINNLNNHHNDNHSDSPQNWIAPDLPGHGLSDPLPSDTVSALIDWLQWLCGELKIQRCTVHAYGLSVALARACKKQCPELIQEIHAHGPKPIPGEEEQLPELQPRWDGGHLLAAWYMLRDGCLHHPWYRREAASRCPDAAIPTAEILSHRLLDLFRAGVSLQKILPQWREFYDRNSDD